MKTDKELLQLAAKAVGIDLKYNWLGNRDARQPWDPLIDDGDAFLLAVNLKFKIDIKTIVASVTQIGGSANSFIESCDNNDESRLRATRRAIVRAAAAIGESME